MEKLKNRITPVLDELTKHDEASLKMRRAAQVQELLKESLEKVYKGSAPYMLFHINAVYIKKDQASGVKELIIYSDDSTVRADLDARQEYIKLDFRYHGEDIQRLRLISSRGTIKKHHPFVEKEDILGFDPQYLVYFEQHHHPLSVGQEQAVEQAGSHIEDERVAQSFLKAMRANLKSHD